VLANPRKNKALYNKRMVVNSLWKMQHKKCCYCEQLIPEDGHLKAVDHFKPKSIFKRLTNNWDNLLLACSQCNGKKSNRFPYELCNNKDEAKVVWVTKDNKNKSLLSKGKYLVINPSDSKTFPEAHFDYVLDDNDDLLGLIKHNSKLGQFTIEVIGLADSFHTKGRRLQYFNLYRAYLVILEAKDLDDQQTLSINLNTFSLLLHPGSRYAGFARAFARANNLEDRFGVKIPS